MKIKPVYAENLVVAIVADQTFHWYVMDLLYCYLDMNSKRERFKKAGYELKMNPTFRFGIQVVDEHTKDAFLQHLKPQQFSAQQLRELLKEESDRDERMGYYPCVYINFDERVFYSDYYEMQYFEKDAPKGWTSDNRAFLELVPKGEEFWIDEDGKDMLLGEDLK